MVVGRLDLREYEASRAAALAGVPLSTPYHGAREQLVPPSVSATWEKLRSYRDLLTLRVVRWLRTDKPDVARTTMTQVRRVLGRGPRRARRTKTVPLNEAVALPDRHCSV